jgi:hypothetical protein
LRVFRSAVDAAEEALVELHPVDVVVQAQVRHAAVNEERRQREELPEDAVAEILMLHPADAAAMRAKAELLAVVEECSEALAV